MCLPKPGYYFTIPSVYDGTTLDCRLYHPKQQHQSNLFHTTNAAIVAHPYAPLGGCYDDPVVASMGKALLDAGYIVGTFNFRGAGGSVGRTSWSAKPELADYVSFYGFMLSYLSGIQPSNAGTPCAPDQPDATSVPTSPTGEHDMSVGARQPMRLVLSGYSYGSMIASNLPSLDFVLNMFSSPILDSTEAEVRLRASNIAQLRNNDVQSRQRLERQRRGRNSLGVSNAILGNSHAVSVGGYESESASRRISRESSRQSLDVGVRKSLDRVRQRFASRRSSSPEDHPAETAAASDVQLAAPEICYLLISPLLPPVSSFTTAFSNLSFATKKSSSASIAGTPASKPDVELVLHPSCAVFGDKDAFTSQRKLRKWAENLKQKPNSQFQFFEIDGAGHFWQEKDLAERMKSSIQQWLGAIDVLQAHRQVDTRSMGVDVLRF